MELGHVGFQKQSPSPALESDDQFTRLDRLWALSCLTIKMSCIKMPLQGNVMNQVVPFTRHICCEQVWEPGDRNGGDSSYGHIPVKEHMGIQHRSDVWNSIICGSQPWNPVVHWYLQEGSRENWLPDTRTCSLSGLKTQQCCSKPSN
jgi:hypothetical protein